MNSRGFSLVEVAIAMVILTIALIGTMSSFPYIMRSILMSKAKSIANLVATEQLEVYRNLPYYKLQVTTATATDSRFEDIDYDIGIYPKQISISGGISYEIMTYVEKVSETSAGDFTHVSWADPDVGMKRVSVCVAYHSEGAGGDWKKITMSLLKENTDRQQLNASISGIVKTTDTASTLPIPNANIYILENPAFNTASDSSGQYLFNVPAGSWTLITSATGFFLNTSSSVVCSSGTVTSRNIPLSRKFLGTVTGYVYIQDHLVITQVVADYTMGQASQEWVELYNPTTYSILIASKSTPASAYDLWYVTVTYIDSHDFEPYDDHGDSRAKYILGSPSHPDSVFVGFRSTSTLWQTEFSSRSHIYIPPQGFFLLANFSTINVLTTSDQRIADGYYYNGAAGGDVIQHSQVGGIRVTGIGGYGHRTNSDWHDGLSWSAGGPSRACEGSSGYGVTITNGAGSNIYYRHAWKQGANTSDYGLSITARNTSRIANNFDRNVNGGTYSTGSDWDLFGVANYITASSGVVNADTQMKPYSGEPAAGGHVSANDGLSGAAFIQTFGSFTLTDVATGAWTVAMISSTHRNPYYMELTAWMGSTTPRLGIPNNFTSPAWQSSVNHSTLSLITTNGTIAGRVANALGQGLSNITIDSLSQTVQTNTQGYYRINISSGEYTVGCNLISTNYSYTKASSENVVVELGQITDNVNFTLITGGNIQGFVTANGVDPLPGYAVSLQRDNAEYKTGTTGSDGRFLITSIATCPASNPYLLFLVTDDSESVDISTGKTVVPVMGTTLDVGTFRVTAGYGTITGRVTYAGNSIETGVVLITSTQPITTTSSGPLINSSLVNGPTTYFLAASDSAGRYSLRVLGNSVYHLYGYYTDDSVSSSTIRMSSTSVPMRIGESRTINFAW